MTEWMIEVKNISMRFNLAREKIDNVKEYVIKSIKKQIQEDEFYALKNVSFSIEKGDSFAIIGENGCGKSTLLKVISGIFAPTVGEVKVNGKISPLIELGAGFDMELTARENIYLNGAVLGYSKEYIDEHFKEIVDFSELWEFVDVPVKNFSSGMVARLGFAVATVVVPDILIVDEILAVGDLNFQYKCEQKMQEMLNAGVTLIFVSHDIQQVKKICRNAIWLKKGILQKAGSVDEVADAYVYDMEHGAKGLVSEAEGFSEVQLDNVISEEIKKENIPRRHEFISYIRVLACLMVVYDHAIAFILKGLGVSFPLMTYVDRYIAEPLGIIQDFGFLGVVLFFAITGFLNTESLERSTAGKYCMKKISSLFPMLFLSMFVLWGFQYGFGMITKEPTYWAQFGWKEWLSSATLVGYFTDTGSPITGVTWFLVVVVIYYFFSGCLKGILEKSASGYVVMMLGGISAFTFIFADFGGMWFRVASYVQYIPLILFGQLIYLWKKGKIGTKKSILFLIFNFVLLLQNIRLFLPNNYAGNEMMSPSIIIGWGTFIVLLYGAPYIHSNILVDFFAKISYAIYLCHMPIAQMLIPMLISNVGIAGAITVSLLSVVAIAYVETAIVDIIFRRKRKEIRWKNGAGIDYHSSL